jgi:transposase, IS5 family
MVGLHDLKALYDESDEPVVSKWVENPYWQYFCGEVEFQHELSCHPTSLMKWRKRVGSDGMEQLLKHVIKTAMLSHALPVHDVARVIVDTTVQEKAIAYPTDARLYDKARRTLVRAARQQQVKLRQSYVRVGRQAMVRQSRYACARQMKRAQQQTRKLRTILGCVSRDLKRKITNPSGPVKALLERVQQLYTQQKDSKNKCYSVHAPEVECIDKGKPHERYEFGCMVALLTTSKSNWIVGLAARQGNPYDGATLKPALKQVKILTGIKPKQVLVDQGFRGSEHHPRGVEVLIKTSKQPHPGLKRKLKRRNAIEPIISHVKRGHLLGRNFLQGQAGDSINALLAGCGFNLRKLFCFFLAQNHSGIAF